MLIGGWAVGFYGHPRNTADIDIWIAVDPKNFEAIIGMLKEFIGTAPTLDDFKKRPFQLRMGVPPNRVELITDISGVDFEQCFQHRVTGTMDGSPATLIGLEDLLKNKRAAGRDRDISDVKYLEKYHRLAAEAKSNKLES